MDPNANLEEQRRIAERILNATNNTPESILDDAERLAALVIALDEWLLKRGFLPDAWKR